MMKSRFCLLLLLGGGLHFTRSEWIEIPQFSNNDRVYKVPIVFEGRYDLHPLYDPATHYFEQEVTLEKGISLVHKESPFVDNMAAYVTETIMSPIVNKENQNFAANYLFENVDPSTLQRVGALTEESTLVTNHKKVTALPTPYTGFKSIHGANKTENNGFLNYLPIELLRRVHKTLKSQLLNLERKIKFFKFFEHTLLKEIESQLRKSLLPHSRLPRDVRYHDNNDEAIGFPSLEGALISISFLTFAVYLVRLVMMLFRSSNSNTASSLLIGRNRRSINDFNEEIIRIRSYLD